VWGKRTDKLLTYVNAGDLEKEFGGNHDPYPCPDELAAPLYAGKVAAIGTVAYEPIKWIGDTSALSPAASSASSIQSPKSDEGISDYEDDDEDAQLVSQVSSLNLQSPTSSSAPEQKKKKRTLRSTIGKMFSTRSRKPSPLDQATDKDDLPAPVAPLSPTSTKEDRPLEVVPPRSRPRVAVFGATGKTGRALVLELLEKGNDVTAFVRVNGSRLAPELVQKAEASGDSSRPKMTMVVGDVFNLLDMERVVEDCDAVVCVMGVVPALSGGTCEFLPKAIVHMMEAMEKMKVRRLVVVSSAHASQSWWEQGAGLMSNLTKPIYWKNHYQYVAKMEDEVKLRSMKGVIDATVVRPGTLTDGPASTGIRIEEGYVFADTGPGEVSRADLVKFLIQEAADTKAQSKYCGKGVAIGKA